MTDQTVLRVCLILGAFVTAGYVLRRVRQARVQIEDTIYWLALSAVLLLVAVFPGIASWVSDLLGFVSPINCVFLIVIFLLLARQFVLSIRVSQLDSRLRILTERIALNQQRQEQDKQKSPDDKMDL